MTTTLTDTPGREELKAGSPRWQQLRLKAQRDLYWFAAKVLGLEDKIPMTPKAHLALCLFASRQTGIPEIDSARMQLIQVGRSWGKSALVTNARCTQRLISNPNWCIGIANEKQDNANAFLGAIKANFESNEFLQFLFPECIPENWKDAVWRSDRIIIKRTIRDAVSPSVLATGVGATVTGVHMNEWLVDDLISQDAAENARAGSFSEIEKTNRWLVRLLPLLKNPFHDPITFIGTPWWLGDCYEYIEEAFGQGDHERYIWTVTLPSGEQQMHTIERKGQLAIFRMPARDDSGRPYFPEQLDDDALDHIRSIDPVFFAAQYLLQPGAGDASDFNEEWLKPFEWEGSTQVRYRDLDGNLRIDNVRDMTVIISVDPAISDREQSARSAMMVVATNGTQLFLLEAWAGRVGATGLGEKIIEAYTKYKAGYIITESVAYQEALGDVIDLLAKQYGIVGRLPVYEHKTGGNMKKDVRIRGMEPYFRKGFFHVHKTSQQNFLDEYRGFPYIKLRDMLDALSFQKEYWERLATRDGHKGEPLVVRDRLAKALKRARAITDRYSRRSYRRET